MNKIITLTLNDFRNIYRDSILKYFFLAVPALFIFILIFILPVAIKEFPIISGYTDLILSFFSMEIPMIIGFVISFIMLDEKDEKVFTALRVMPVSLFQFLFYRLFFSVFFTFLFIFLMLLLNNIYDFNIGQMMIYSFLFSLLTPIVVLLEVSFAGNKVTGFTMFKGINSIFIIPAASYFITAKWKLIIGLIPSYWPLNSLYLFCKGEPAYFNILFSVLYSILIIIILSYIFKRRVYYS